MKEQPPPALGALPPAAALRVDQACLRFEAAFRKPRIEDYLGDEPEPERTVLLRELLALELACRRAAGESPRPEEYLPRFAAALAGFSIVAMFIAWRATFSGLTTFVRIGLGIGIGYVLLTIAGHALCLFAPPRHGARALAAVALAVEAVLLIGLGAFLWVTLGKAADALDTAEEGEKAMKKLLQAKDMKPEDLEAIAKKSLEASRAAAKGSGSFFLWLYLLQIVGYAHLVVVPLLLRALAFNIKEGGIAENCQNLLKLCLASLGLGVFSQMLVRLGLGVLGPVFSLLSMIGTVMGVAYLVLCLVVLLQLRTAITRRLD